MQIKNRLFPYPVLNQDAFLSSYKKTSVYEFVKDSLEIEDGYQIIKNAHYNLNNKTIYNLIKEGKAKAMCLVECQDTLYRKGFEITDQPADIKIECNKLNGKVSISSFVYLTEDLQDYTDEDLLDDYSDYKFNIKKYSFLAVDDGVQFRCDYPDEADDKISSIFIVIPNGNKNDDITRFDLLHNKIQIMLPQDAFDVYDNIKDSESYRDIFFSILIIPSLIYAIGKFKKSDFDNLSLNYSWFNSLSAQYKKIYGKELDEETFKDIDECELAQVLMGKPTGKALSDLYRVSMPDFIQGGDEYE